MNLKQIIEQINRQLTISDSYSERRLLQIIEDEEQLIYSEEGFDFFLIPIEDEEMDEQERLEGLFVSVTYNILENDRSKNFLMIKTQSSRREVFVPFISELISKDLSNPIDALNDTLKEWRDFWSGKRARLSKHEQVGLFGELYALSRLLQHSSSKLVEKWGGPLDWLHDFESDRLDLEIKTTTKQPDSVYISKISQVAPMEGAKELHLVVIGLEEGEDLDLPKIVDLIRSQISNTIEINQFEKVLHRSGYRDSEKHHYLRTYSVGFVKSHEITDNSPVLKPNLLGDIPGTVEDIKYNLLTHAMDTVELNDDKWLHFSKMM
jgi:hypothetical protein